MRSSSSGRLSYLSFNELYTLYRYACKTKGKIVELGTRKAGTACALGLSDKENSDRVYTVDNYLYLHEDQFYRNKIVVSNYELKCNLISMDSSACGRLWNNGAIDMMFFDAGHQLSDVKADIRAWIPHVSKGGYLCFHDYVRRPRYYKKLGKIHNTYGVSVAVNRLLRKPGKYGLGDKKYRDLGVVDKLIIIQKP